MDIFDELARHTGHTNHELGVAAAPAAAPAPHTPKRRLTRRQVSDIARPIVERRGGTLTTIDGRSLTAVLANGHVEIRPGLEVVAFSGAGDSTGDAIGLAHELRAAFKAALKTPPLTQKIHVRHIGQPFAPIAAILDAHLPASAAWQVVWDGERASVSTDGGSIVVESGRPWGPYSTSGHAIPEVVHEAFDAVREPLYDRLLAKMSGRAA